MQNHPHGGLAELLESSEDELIDLILDYAEQNGYTRYTSTLREAWRLSISGLTASIVKAADDYGEPPQMRAEDNLQLHEAAQFGIQQARLHRERGVSLNMFFSLLKYYRQSYLDLLQGHRGALRHPDGCLVFVNRIFDIIEAGLCLEWAGGGEQKTIHEMQIRNLEMTNEKNKFLTIFESLPMPLYFISAQGTIDHMNLAAALFLGRDSVAGDQYYPGGGDGGASLETQVRRYVGQPAVNILPWFAEEIQASMSKEVRGGSVEKKVLFGDKVRYFRIRTSPMLDVSKKFSGFLVILEDITGLKTAQNEVATLTGLIPICAHCKKMRDDSGYWSRLEEYIEKRSSAFFSHSICNDCFLKYYGIDE